MGESRRGLTGWSAATVLVSAFLLFQVQPMVSKMILPWFGGSPSVWTMCMLFFQVFLLGGLRLCARAGTTAADARGGRDSPGLVAERRALSWPCCRSCPLHRGNRTDSSQPQLRILILLATHVGLPYFLLSASAPLVQAWYSRAFHGRSPYRFYALSNVGSLTALLSYPFLIEPAFDLSSPEHTLVLLLHRLCDLERRAGAGDGTVEFASGACGDAGSPTRHRQGVTDRALPAVVAPAGVRNDEPAGRHESDLPGRGGRAVPVDCCR